MATLGFLSTEDGEISGNMAFKDQIMGLKWVQDNVRYFGGDPDRVMIFGKLRIQNSINFRFKKTVSKISFQMITIPNENYSSF